MNSEIELAKTMKGKKILYKKGYLDKHYYGNHTNNPVEAEKMDNKIRCDMTINSHFGNPYNRAKLSPIRIKKIK